jgi:transposase
MRARAAFAPAGYNPPRSNALPEWGHIHAELRRRGVTLALLWEEYRGHHPDGYGYSRFCDLYVEWRHGITATMRQTHVAGEKLFVDFAGDTVPVFDGLTGEVRAAKICGQSVVAERRAKRLGVLAWVRRGREGRNRGKSEVR